MQGYKEYKETGLAWLGKIPSHWVVEKIGALFVERREKVSDKDFAPLSVTKFGIVPQLDSAAKSNDGDNRKKVVTGDFVINSRSDRKGSSGFSPLTGSVSLINLALTPRETENTDYLHYLLKSHSFIEEYYRNGRGIVADLWTTRFSEMKTIQLPLPPQEEQDNIVQFLNHKLEKIRKFIANKQKLIALLEEQKQAIINQAVTKGLDPNAPMKHSGIDWLGEVPKHWEVKNIKSLANITRGRFNHRPRNDAALYNNGQYPFIQTGDVANANMYIATYKQKLNEHGCAVSKQFPAGTLVMTIAANIGDVAILNFDAYFPDSIVGFIPKKDINLYYLYYCFSSMKNEFLREAPVNTQANLNVQRIGGKSIPIPPYEEQEKIVLLLSEHTQKIEKIVKKTKKEIDLIQEYKTSLISSVVTGQVKI